MKIAILLLNKGRGSGEVAREHVKYLLKLGHEVYFLYPEIGDGIKGATNIDVELHTDIKPVHEYLPSAGTKQKQVSRMSLEEMSAYLPDYESALEQIAGKVDIFIGHHANLSAIAVHNIAKKYNKPYVLFLHGTGIEPRHQGYWDDQVWELIEEAVLQAKGLLVTTEYVRDKLIKPLISLPDDKFLVLPCGVDLEDFRPDNTEGIREKYNLPDKYVICPGALTKSKGPQNVVEASNEFADLAQTVLIGAGEMKEELMENLEGKGMLLGYVSSEDKAKLINAAAILTAAPEKKEHFGIIYAEALAGGTPVVAYRGGGVGSIVTPDVGILTERSPEELGKEISKLLSDKKLLEEMAVNGRQRAEEKYDYNKLVAKLVNWLEKFVD
jgi:glycosyltransferase involved in cell wall biosynthesis